MVIKIEFTPLSDCNVLPFLERLLRGGGGGQAFFRVIISFVLKTCPPPP